MSVHTERKLKAENKRLRGSLKRIELSMSWERSDAWKAEEAKRVARIALK